VTFALLGDGTAVSTPSACVPVADRDPGADDDVSSRSLTPSALCGQWSGAWLSFGGPDLAPDQRWEDGGWMLWSTAPLTHTVAVVGAPAVRLRVSVSEARALLSARLCAVQPATGASLLLSRGCLNLTHRRGHEPAAVAAATVTPHEPMDVEFQLNACAFDVPEGFVLRLALSTVDFPLLWPSPAVPSFTVACGRDGHCAAASLSALLLPVRRSSGRQACAVAVHACT
jgi:predicted acyl esterase